MDKIFFLKTQFTTLEIKKSEKNEDEKKRPHPFFPLSLITIPIFPPLFATIFLHYLSLDEIYEGVTYPPPSVTTRIAAKKKTKQI